VTGSRISADAASDAFDAHLREEPTTNTSASQSSDLDRACPLTGADLENYQHRVRRTVASIAADIAGRVHGDRRNITLNDDALRAGRFIIGAHLAPAEFRQSLVDAYVASGMTSAAGSATVASAWGSPAAQQPRLLQDWDTSADKAKTDTYLAHLELNRANGADDLSDEERYRLIDWRTVWDKERTGVEWLLEPIIAKGRQTSMYSAPKVGKSLLMLWAAVELAINDDEPLVVLYVDHENVEDDIVDRLKAMGREGIRPTRLHYSLLGEWPPLDTAAGGAALADYAEKVGADLVIVDTATRTVAGLEDKADTWAAWYRHTGVPAASIAPNTMTTMATGHSAGDDVNPLELPPPCLVVA